MIFFFTLYNVFLQGNVLARPPPPLGSTSEISFCPREIDPNKFSRRSEWAIFWSCSLTLIACSWVAIHPNIPAPTDSRMRIFVRRLMMMAYMLILPQMMIVWAFRQWYGARDIAKRHKGRGWTTTHGFFALMGGFMLYKNGVMTRTLVLNELEELAAEGMIDWPSISEEDIKDKSKGDHLSKAFVILQTTWFITQCIARGVAGLNLTELELTTLAFAVLNGISYFFWWDKPLDVSRPIPVHLRGAEMRTMYSEVTETLGRDNEIPSLNYRNLAEMQSNNTPVVESIALEPHPQHSAAFAPPSPLFESMVNDLPIFFIIRFSVTFIPRCEFMDPHHSLAVPTFYAPPITKRTRFIGIPIAILFGGIHCIAWSFDFLSVGEQLVWRISAVAITVTPIILAVGYLKPGDPSDPSYLHLIKVIKASVLILFQLVYGISRAALLICPLLALRSLPPNSLLDIPWSNYLPHL